MSMENQNEPKKKMSRAKELGIIAVAIFIVSIGVGLSMDYAERNSAPISTPAPVVSEVVRPEKKVEEEKKQEDKNDINDSIARVCAKNYITSKLKAPSTADFPWFDWQVKKTGDNKYLVKSYVDSQNSFGAKIRTNFVCEVSVANIAKYECDTKCSTD